MAIVYYSIFEEPFEIYGLDEDSYPQLLRMPHEVAKALNQHIEIVLNRCTSGGRVRFKTNSPKIYIKVKTKVYGTDIHPIGNTTMNRHGFDMYLDKPNSHEFFGTFTFGFNDRYEYVAAREVGGGEKELTINMPLVGAVESMEIGLEEGSTLSRHTPYKHQKPIVYYGSSITQGECVSRPGKLYSHVISRKYDTNFKCLGLSGSCKAEMPIAEYMAGLDMSAFVCDYDHNAATVEYLKDTHYRLYETIRAKNPDVPYFMITKPDYRYSHEENLRRCVIMESYIRAYTGGDRNVYFIDGTAFFNGMELRECTFEGCHPTDEGHKKMADYIGDVIAKVLNL